MKLVRTLLVVIALLVISASAFADGKVLAQPVNDPVTAWRFLDIRNAIADEKNPTAYLEVGYFTQSGRFHHGKTIVLQGVSYDQFLASLSTVADGAYEVTLTKDIVDVDGNKKTVPDAQAIFRFRIAKYLISIGELPGTVTAEAVK